MPRVLVSENLRQLFFSLLPCLAPDIFEGHVDNGVFPLEGPVIRALSPDGFVIEILRCVLIRNLKEGPQHVHIQGFPETPRPREQRNHRPLIQKILYQHRLVDVIILRGRDAIIRYAYRQWQFALRADADVIAGSYTHVPGTDCVFRDVPFVLRHDGAGYLPGPAQPCQPAFSESPFPGRFTDPYQIRHALFFLSCRVSLIINAYRK